MIRNYKKGDLSTGFIGVRVAVSVGGKIKQKWYASSKFATPTALGLASEQEKKWLKLQLDHKRNAIKSQSNNTGIKGLSFTYEEKKRDNGKCYLYPIISYQHSKQGKLIHSKWRLDKDLNISNELWQEICLFIKNARTSKHKTYEEMLHKKPDSRAYFMANQRH